MSGFWVATADENGNRITASERLLTPGPTAVDYPTEPAGSIVETADSKVVQQQPSRDGRRRVWIWANYPEALSGDRYRDIWNTLQALRSRYRKEYGAVTPYVWIKDETSQELRRQVVFTGTATSGSSDTLTDTAQSWDPNSLTDYEIEIISGTGAGQVRKIISNTGTTVTVDIAWSVTPDATSKYAVRGWVNDWFRVRVLGVTRKPREDGGLLRFTETRFEFAIEDATFNYLG